MVAVFAAVSAAFFATVACRVAPRPRASRDILCETASGTSTTRDKNDKRGFRIRTGA
jgi:hypothetical protein